MCQEEDKRQKMSQLLETYSYTCSIVGKNFPNQSEASNFPGLFFVAYKNWSQSSSRGLRLKEVSEECLDEVGNTQYSVWRNSEVFFIVFTSENKITNFLV